jgi:hypothetical protein
MDDYLEHIITSHSSYLSELQVPQEGKDTAGCPPAALFSSLLPILHTTSSILENCSNKHLYASIENLTFLLAAPEPEVVLATLQTLSIALRRTFAPGSSNPVSSELIRRLLTLAQNPSGEAEAPSLVLQAPDFIEWCRGNVGACQKVIFDPMQLIVAASLANDRSLESTIRDAIDSQTIPEEAKALESIMSQYEGRK